jgi:transposase-like protein
VDEGGLSLAEWKVMKPKTIMPQLNPPMPSIHEENLPATLVCQSQLEQFIRAGARQMLHAALEAEVSEYIERHGHLRDPRKRRVVVRNGYAQARNLQTPIGPMAVQAPRVSDRRETHRFTSAILPPYLRRTPSLENLIPILYLKGISTSAMPEALAPLLGPAAAGLSPASIVRLTQAWQHDYEQWSQRDLREENIVYLWADGIYCNVRLTDERPCLLVVVGARADGTKVLLALQDGERESELSWIGLLRDLKRRGLKQPPKLAVADGALGFWPALQKTWPRCEHQRCWVHKTANVLDKLPKKLQPQAKQRLHEIWQADTRKHAEEAFEEFLALYGAKYPKACACLSKDREQLLTFYAFPAEHWRHLRTTNPIESSFATVRHRHRQTKGNGSRQATLAMMFQLARECEKGWRRLNGHHILPDVIEGVVFVDGVRKKAA